MFGGMFGARLRVGGRITPRLIQGANPIGKVGPVRTRDLQRFIGNVEDEDLFLFGLQGGHGIDPFRFATSLAARIALFHEQLTCSLRVNYQHPIRKQTVQKNSSKDMANKSANYSDHPGRSLCHDYIATAYSSSTINGGFAIVVCGDPAFQARKGSGQPGAKDWLHIG
jgi:hypothetical protein